jgi:TonB family protein
MPRLFAFIVVLAFASAGAAADARAQSRRVWRAEPPKEEQRGEQSEKQDKAEGEAKGEAKDKQPPQDEARADGDDDKPVGSREVTTRAIIKSKPNPSFTYEARLKGVRGTVKLRIILGSDGKVRDRMQVLEGLPYGMTEQAMKAARRIEFEPARKDGRPVSQYVIVVYHFNLH